MKYGGRRFRKSSSVSLARALNSVCDRTSSCCPEATAVKSDHGSCATLLCALTFCQRRASDADSGVGCRMQYPCAGLCTTTLLAEKEEEEDEDEDEEEEAESGDTVAIAD